MPNDINMERLEELNATMKYYSDESDRGVTLIIAAYIEKCLRRTIEAFLINSTSVKELFEGSYAPFGSLSGKTKAAYVMGLITKDELKKIDAVRQVRNVFAHEISASFNHKKIEKICRPLVDDWGMSARHSFLHMAQNTLLPLLYRDLEVEKWKRPELTNAYIHIKNSKEENDE